MTEKELNDILFELQEADSIEREADECETKYSVNDGGLLSLYCC